MRSLSIRQKIPLLIVTPIVGAVTAITLAGYIYGQRAVNKLAVQTSSKTSISIGGFVENYLAYPHQILEINQAAIESGQLDPNDPEALRKFAFQLVPKQARSYFYGKQNGDAIAMEVIDDQVMYWKRDETTAPNAEVFKTNAQGEPQEVEEVLLYDPRKRPWYQKAVEAGQLTWSDIYIFAGNPILGIGAVSPYYNNEKELQGVFLIDVALSDIDEFLESLSISPQGEAFIIEPDGFLVGNSLGTDTFLEQDGELSRVNGTESENSIIREVSKAVVEQYGQNFEQLEGIQDFTLKIEGENYYINVLPFQDGKGIAWYVVVVIPKKDFQYVINASTRSALIIGVIVALLGAVLGLLVARSIVQPIESLNYAAKSIQENRFEPAILTKVVQRSDEIGHLAQVFEDMGQVIMANQTSLQEQMKTLEDEVAQAKRNSQQNDRYNEKTLKELLMRSRQARQQVEGEQNLLQLLKKVTYFSGLSEEDLNTLIRLGEKKVVGANTVVFHENEPGDAFYVILKGSVEVYVEQINKFLNVMSSGSFFGELSLLLGIPRTATVKTQESTVFFRLDQNAFKKYYNQYLKPKYPDILEIITTQIEVHKEELASRQEWQKTEGDNQENNSIRHWIKNRLKTLFS